MCVFVCLSVSEITEHMIANTLFSGKEWQGFAMRHSQEWVDTYQGFLEAGVPLLIVTYEELEDPNQIRGQLLRITNFLHVPIKSSMFECVVNHSQEYALKVGNFISTEV